MSVRRWKGGGWRRLLIAGSGLGLLALALAAPLDTSGLDAHPRPARDYAGALERVAALQGRDSPLIRQDCRTLYFGHGHRTKRAALLVHGLTNCPKQFEALGRLLHESGQNVLIVRLPHHGLSDRLTKDLERLSAEEVARITDDAVDAAAGLGERVTVVGLSVGAVAAAWAAQERSEVDRAIIIAPLLGLASVPRALTSAMACFWLFTPNRFHWWVPRERENLAGPRQVYPRFSTRALGETLRLAAAVHHRSRRRPPAAGDILLVRIAGDRAVNNGAILDLFETWKGRGARVRTYEFPATLGLGHDLIDPDQVGARIDVVYPVLMGWMR